MAQELPCGGRAEHRPPPRVAFLISRRLSLTAILGSVNAIGPILFFFFFLFFDLAELLKA